MSVFFSRFDRHEIAKLNSYVSSIFNMLGLVQLRRFSSPPKVEAEGLEGEIPDCVMDQIWINKFAHACISFQLVTFACSSSLQVPPAADEEEAGRRCKHPSGLYSGHGDHIPPQFKQSQDSRLHEPWFENHRNQISVLLTPLLTNLFGCHTRNSHGPDMTWAPNTLPVILVRIMIIGGSPKVFHQGNRIGIP